MTYSICAYDPRSGELGVASVTAWPAAGAIVPWVEPGFGAVATQAFTNPDLGPFTLTQLREGLEAREALAVVLADDAARELRQVGVVDAHGHTAGHTGRRCVPVATHAERAGAIAIGNMLEREGAPEAMLDAFHDGAGDLAERMLTALRVGSRGGGDIRGRRSAAMLVAPGAGPAQAWARRFDLRTDSSPQPIDELTRLLATARAYEALDTALAAADHAELEVAVADLVARHATAGADPVLDFWLAVALFANGQPVAAEDALERALVGEPRLREFARRYRAAGQRDLFAKALAWVARGSST